MRGRPFQPGNKFGRGRPKGSRNKRTMLGKELLDEHGEAIIRSALVAALRGDKAILRALLSYVLPRPKDLPPKPGPLPMKTIEDLAKTFEHTVEKVSSGRITTNQASEILDWIEARRRIIETQELASRVKALEQVLTVEAGRGANPNGGKPGGTRDSSK